ncbi:hypothetical protein EWM64_g3957 [Hericium alpestre]|uniref:DNA replication regulator Sld3 C-terminal domain-containing protein n=1 Tax=Hericium alpestre TaxID=135208 RepID=A0A4Z0A1I0_9AGAM|nr:hypothetical protein EWM64_g3957 [Hericium alpestre]
MHYKLATTGHIKWNENQEKSISISSTLFHPSQPYASLDERVRLIYLQFLYLPEVLFPLRHLTRMLLSLVESNDAAALHASLDSISLTNRWCSYKYQEQVPKVLAQRLQVGLEDQMMLFAFDHRADSESMDDSDEDTSRTWLEQMEKREYESFSLSITCKVANRTRRAQIQILIHLLRLTLPGPCPPPTNRPVPALPRKRRRLQHVSSSDTEEATPEHILEDRLESLMDRLVLWQMALPATDAEQDAFDTEGTQQQAAIGKELRDWTQEFCEDVVQPL